MKFAQSFAVAGTALLVAGAPAMASGGDFELMHDRGTLVLVNTPQRIISYDLAVLDTLAALDVAVVGAPKALYQGHLARYKDTTTVGTLFEPDYAALREIKPDLIIASTRARNAVSELSKLAPTVSFETDTNAFLDSVRKANIALGKAFGKEDQAAAALSHIEQNVNALKQRNMGKKAAVLFTVKGNVIPHAPGDRFGYVHELTGTESVLPAKDPKAVAEPRPAPDSPAAKAAAEARENTVAEIAAAEPDWLFVLDRGAINNGERSAEATLAGHPLLSQTRAFKEGRVYYMDPNGWYVVGGGLNNLKAITDDLLAKMGGDGASPSTPASGGAVAQ